MIFIYLLTPFLGLLKNYVKYKTIYVSTFLRTPLIYLFLHYIIDSYNPYRIIVFERWFFFIYKIGLSYYRDDYHNKKEKYIQKYGLNYK